MGRGFGGAGWGGQWVLVFGFLGVFARGGGGRGDG